MGNSQKKNNGTDICGSLFLTNPVGYIIGYSVDNITFHESHFDITGKKYQETVQFQQITKIDIEQSASSGGRIIKIYYIATQHTAMFEFVCPNKETLNQIKLMKFDSKV